MKNCAQKIRTSHVERLHVRQGFEQAALRGWRRGGGGADRASGRGRGEAPRDPADAYPSRNGSVGW
jgi:hypothetical protein